MSLLQEALKRKEQDESQGKPEAGNAEISSPVLPAKDTNLPTVGQQAAEVKNTGNPLSSPPQSMPVAGQPQAAVSQNILTQRSTRPDASERAERAIALPSSAGGPALGEASPNASLAKGAGRRKVSLLWAIVAVIAVFIGLTVTAGIVFLFYRVSSPAKVKTVQQAGPVNNTPAVAAAGANISAGQIIPVSHPKLETAITVEMTAQQSAAQDTNKASTSAIAQNAETKPGQQQSAGNIESKPTPAKPVFFKPKAPHAASPTARWPALKLTGILRGAGKTESTAFINGKMIGAGQTIADVTIVEIQADGVILKYGNEKRFLRVGAVSY